MRTSWFNNKSPLNRPMTKSSGYRPETEEYGIDRPKFEILLLDDLNVDKSYQPDPTQRRIDKFAQGWDWLQVGTPQLNRRPNGMLYIIDGQHRIAAARKKGIDSLQCEVFHFPNVKQEAEYFHRLNNERRKFLAPVDQYRARVMYDPQAMRIDGELKGRGLDVCKKSASNSLQIAAVGSLFYVAETYGDLCLWRTLDTIMDIYNEADANRWVNPLLVAFGCFINAYNDMDPKRLKAAVEDAYPTAAIFATNIREYDRVALRHAAGAVSSPGGGRQAGKILLHMAYMDARWNSLFGKPGNITGKDN